MLVILIDGLWSRCLTPETTPFLDSLSQSAHSALLESILGYSASIRATAFSGVPPSVHEQWSKFQLNPTRSQFGKADALAFIDHIPSDLLRRSVKFALSRTVLNSLMGTSSDNHLSCENVPMSLLPLFEYRPEGISSLLSMPVSTVFNQLNDIGIPWAYVNVPFFPSFRHKDAIRHEVQRTDVCFVYIGGLDQAAHRVGRETTKLQSDLTRIDRFTRWLFKVAAERWGKGFEWLLFSDHGMETVTRYLDPVHFSQRLTSRGVRAVAFYDSTMARFWFENGEQRVDLGDVSEWGHFLSEEERARYGVNFEHNRYGDGIFLLNPGVVFHPSYVSWLRPRGMHGYRPDIESQMALLISSMGCGSSSTHVHQMVDVSGMIETGAGIRG